MSKLNNEQLRELAADCQEKARAYSEMYRKIMARLAMDGEVVPQEEVWAEDETS